MALNKVHFKGYSTIKHLGSGGAGDVYLAVNNVTKEEVAIKLLRSDSPLSSDRQENFLRFSDEVSATIKINSKYVVKALSWYQTDDGFPYIVFEYVKGGNLENQLENIKNMPYRKIYKSLIVPLLTGLKDIHAEGIIHRDIKPENLFLDSKGYYKTGDCGLATFSERSAKTKTGMIVGTPLYMAPERITSSKDLPTIQTDIYSAGLVIIKALTGNLPTIDKKNNSPLQFIREISKEDIHKCGIPDELIDILFKSVRKESHLRFKSAAKFLKAFPSTITKPVQNLENENITVESPLRKKLSINASIPKISKFPKKTNTIRRIALPLLAITLLSVYLFYVSEENKSSQNYSIQWLKDHSHQSKLYFAVLTFSGTTTDIEKFHKFIVTEETQWNKVKNNVQKKEHQSELLNIERAFTNDRFGRKIIESIRLKRSNEESEYLKCRIQALKLLASETGKRKGSFCITTIQLYTYLLKDIICTARKSDQINSEIAIDSYLNKAAFFYSPSIKPPAACMEALKCGKQLTLLIKILNRKQLVKFKNEIGKKALQTISLIPPYKPQEVFNSGFFEDVVSQFDSQLKVYKTTFSQQNVLAEALFKEGKRGFKKKSKELGRKTAKVNDSFFTSPMKPVSEKNIIEMQQLFSQLEKYIWYFICANTLNPYSSAQTVQLASAFNNLLILTSRYSGEYILSCKSGIKPDFSKDFSTAQLSLMFPVILRQVLIATPSNLQGQNRLYKLLIKIINYEYDVKTKTNKKAHEDIKINADLQNFIVELQKTAPFTYHGIVSYHYQKLGLSKPSRNEQKKFFSLIEKAGNVNLSNIELKYQSVTLPPHWFAIAKAVLTPRWESMVNDDTKHRMRLTETTNILLLLDSKQNSLPESKSDKSQYLDDKKHDATELITFAAAHKIDAYLAIYGEYSKDILKEFKRFKKGARINWAPWRKALTNKERLTAKVMGLRPLKISRSKFLEQK